LDNKLTAVIVDDEPLARKLLGAILSDLDNIEIIAECKNGREALAAAIDLEPDIMFLDIQMPGLTGIDVVNSLQSDVMPMIVFTTAYDKYAVNAFQLHAVDYLLKPLDEDLVVQAVERAFKRRTEKQLNSSKQELMSAVNTIARDPDKSSEEEQVSVQEKLAIKDGKEIDLIKQENIDWIDAAGDLMCIHSEGSTYLMRSTMTALLEKLDPNIFQRIHRSTIVNLAQIEKITPHIKGEYFLHLTCGETLKVSRGYKEVIKSFIG